MNTQRRRWPNRATERWRNQCHDVHVEARLATIQRQTGRELQAMLAEAARNTASLPVQPEQETAP
jgi:hypothetical protein